MGKSLLTYLIALKNQHTSDVYFLDADSSASSSKKQLKFLQGKTPARFALLNLLDSRGKIDRQLLFENLLSLANKEYIDFYIDFGAPESSEFPLLFTKDFSIEEFKELEHQLNARFVFIIVISGNAYVECTNYLQKIIAGVNAQIEVNIYLNESTFDNHPELIDEIREYAGKNSNTIQSVKLFADFDLTTSPHKRIFKKIEEGLGIEAYEFVEQLKIKKEINRL
ncbi:MAG: hypothetical protein C0459_11805 [Chitinophaga sp.]|nr:hypothetical protein [Chitinophaga sp.]